MSEAELAEIKARDARYTKITLGAGATYMVETWCGEVFDDRRALLREVERIMARLECYADDHDGRRVRLPESCDGIACRDDTIKMRDERISTLESRLAESEKGAVRYRWIRENHSSDALIRLGPGAFNYEYLHGAELDAAVDAALAKDPK